MPVGFAGAGRGAAERVPARSAEVSRREARDWLRALTEIAADDGARGAWRRACALRSEPWLRTARASGHGVAGRRLGFFSRPLARAGRMMSANRRRLAALFV